MSRDDDFPPTQQAPPPPPEPPPEAERDPRSLRHGAEQTLPEGTWKDNPLVWIALVVAMFMAVPLLANLTTRDKPVPKPRAAAPASAPEESTPVVLPAAAPAPVNTSTAPSPPAPNANQLPPNLRPQTDATRQMVTKCYENGRVVYTQTGACTGSMTAVPIDTGKNVVGPGGGKAPAGTTR